MLFNNLAFLSGLTFFRRGLTFFSTGVWQPCVCHYTCKLFMPQRGSILHFNSFSLLLTVTCLRLAVRTQTVAD